MFDASLQPWYFPPGLLWSAYFVFWGFGIVILWEQWGLHGAALLSGPWSCLISQVCVVAKQETALSSHHSSFFQFWNLVLVQEGLSTGLTR